MNQVLSEKSLITLVTLGFLLGKSLLLPTPIMAYIQGSAVFNNSFDGEPSMLLVGDRVNLTVRVRTHEDKLVTLDKKYTFKFQIDSDNLVCETTDNTLKDDGTLKGHCTNKGEAGIFDIYAIPEDMNAIDLDGKAYTPNLNRYRAEYKDRNQVCEQNAPIAPSNVTLTKQNDVTVKVAWQHPESFIDKGSYEVMYGTSPTELTHTRRVTNQRELMINDLNPLRDYFFKVQANSICKWQASSGLLGYQPLSGITSAVSIKPSPKPSSSSVPTVNSNSKTTASPQASASVSFQSDTADEQTSPLADEVVVTQNQSASLPTRIWLGIKHFFSRITLFGGSKSSE